MTDRIYLSPPDVGAAERALLLDAFDSGWIAPLGPHVDSFEAELADYTGSKHAVALSSGSAGLHLALLLAGVGPADRVLTSTLTFAASANAVRYVGAEPVFVDCDASSTIDVDLVEDELARSARSGRGPAAVLAVDVYGQVCDWPRLEAVCAAHGIPLIEDAAEALGSRRAGRRAGAFGELRVLSFNGNKILTTSGGGMLLCDDAAQADRARFLATQARDPAPHYEHSTVGYNYRLSNLLAAVGRGQLQTLDRRIERRREVHAAYRAGLGGVPGLDFLSAQDGSNCWLTVLLVDADVFGADRERIRCALEAENIEARPAWKPMHLQPVWRDARSVGGEVSESLFARGLCLPSGSNLAASDLSRIITAVRGAGGR